MKKLAIAAALAAILAAPVLGRVKVKTDYDRTFDFKTLKTWSWPADGPGQVKMVLTKDDDPEAMRARFEPVILSSVEQALAKKGFAKAAAGQPSDFLVMYFALISMNQSAQTIGQFIPGTLEWGIPPFEGRTQSLKIYELGSLVVDVMSPTKQPIWRGLAQAEIHRDRTPAQRDKNLRDAIGDLVKQFPPKK